MPSKTPKYTRENTLQRIESGEKLKCLAFWGEYNTNGWLSNFYPAPFVVKHPNGETLDFSCTEQYFMYKKAACFKDDAIQKEILQPGKKPLEYKKLGRKISNYDDTVWSNYRYEVMYFANLHKYSQHPDLRKQLLDTGDAILIEASPYDKIFGIGVSAEQHTNGVFDYTNPKKWNGDNLLGFCLMEVRDYLREQTK